jgi:hypothetical protein
VDIDHVRAECRVHSRELRLIRVPYGLYGNDHLRVAPENNTATTTASPGASASASDLTTWIAARG